MAIPDTAPGDFENVFWRQMLFRKAGDEMPYHAHQWGHPTILAIGALRVEVEGEETRTYKAPTVIKIRRGKKHRLTALADGTLAYCVLALRDGAGEVLDVDEHPGVAPSLRASSYLGKGK